VQLIAVQWELLLGAWLLSSRYQVGAWFAALGTFLAFAGVSSYLGFTGQTSCGCFGSIKASPWYAVALDVVCITLLSIFRPNFQSRRLMTEDRRSFIRAMVYGIVIFGVVVAIFGAAGVRYGSVEVAMGRLRGESIIIDPPFVDFGDGAAGDVIERSISIRNFTDNEVRIVGGTSDCRCVFAKGLPLTIAPRAAGDLALQFQFPSDAKDSVRQRALIITDNTEQPIVVIRFFGKLSQRRDAK